MLESALQQTVGDNLPLSALVFSGLLEALLGFTEDRFDRFAKRSQRMAPQYLAADALGDYSGEARPQVAQSGIVN